MSTAMLNFGNNQESGDSVLMGASPLAVNVLVDGKGAVRRRPGLSAWASFPASPPDQFQIDGITTFQDQVFWVNGQRRIYRLDPATANTFNMSAGGATSYLTGTGRPMFAETPWRLVIAGGDQLQKVDSGAVLSDRLGSTHTATRIVALGVRLFSDDQTDATSQGQIRFSGLGQTANLTWDAFDVVTAEGKPDPITGLEGNANELFAFGSSSLQVFSPDPVSVLAPGRTINRGIAAANSVIANDEDQAWLTDLGQFVDGNGRTLEELSKPISSTIEGIMQTGLASDCWGFRLNMGQFDCLVWVFPTDGRAFCYQQGGGWSQWHGWSGTGYAPLAVKSHHLYLPTKTHLAGLADGRIVRFDATAGTDMGVRIKAEARTGFQRRGTSAFKHCESLLLTFERGTATGAEPFALLSWRDDLGSYCDPIRIGLGTTGDNVFTVALYSLGTYRGRDWRMEFTDAADYVLAGAEETFSIDKEGD